MNLSTNSGEEAILYNSSHGHIAGTWPDTDANSVSSTQELLSSQYYHPGLKLLSSIILLLWNSLALFIVYFNPPDDDSNKFELSANLKRASFIIYIIYVVISASFSVYLMIRIIVIMRLRFLQRVSDNGFFLSHKVDKIIYTCIGKVTMCALILIRTIREKTPDYFLPGFFGHSLVILSAVGFVVCIVGLRNFFCYPAFLSGIRFAWLSQLGSLVATVPTIPETEVPSSNYEHVTGIIATIMPGEHNHVCLGNFLDLLALVEAYQTRQALDSTAIRSTSSRPAYQHVSNEAAYAVKCAAGAYGVLMSYFVEPGTACATALSCIPCNKKNSKAFLSLSGVHCDNVLMSMSKAVSCRPMYYVVYDDDKRALVVCISGTTSINDIFIDIESSAAPMHSLGFDSESFAHAGMLKAALLIENELLSSVSVLSFLDKHLDYAVLITGHSLGGAVGAILALILIKRNLAVFSSRRIHAYMFGAPPCLSRDISSSELALASITNVIIENDMVGYLTCRSIIRLHAQMQVLLQLFHRFCNENSSDRSLSPFWWCPGRIKALTQSFVESLDVCSTEHQIECLLLSRIDPFAQSFRPLFAPGTLVSLCLEQGQTPKIIEQPVSNLSACGQIIPIKKSMMLNHLISKYLSAIEYLNARHKSQSSE